MTPYKGGGGLTGIIRSKTMKTQEFNVIDKTDGDADTVSRTVIIHDTVGGEPSIITYEDEIAEALETIAGPLPEGYENLPAECATAWTTPITAWGKREGFKDSLGVRIEYFEDFLKESDWIYPDDLLKQDQEEEENTMDMIKIMNTRNHITMTMPQGMFWESYGCWLDGKAKLDAKEIAKALCDDDRERARELLDKYDCVIEFYEGDENND